MEICHRHKNNHTDNFDLSADLMAEPTRHREWDDGTPNTHASAPLNRTARRLECQAIHALVTPPLSAGPLAFERLVFLQNITLASS